MILTMKARGAILINPGGPGEDGLPYGLLCSTISGARPTPPRTANRASFSGKSRGIRPGRLLAAGNGFQHAIAPRVSRNAEARQHSWRRQTELSGHFIRDMARHLVRGPVPGTRGAHGADRQHRHNRASQRYALVAGNGNAAGDGRVLAPYAAENPEVFKLGSSAEEVRQVFRSLRGNLLGVTSALLHETIAQSVNAHVTLFTFYAAKTVQGLLAAYSPETEESLNALLEKNEWGVPPDFRDWGG